jgi:RNA polymerase sigma factor (sigma-70 family)
MNNRSDKILDELLVLQAQDGDHKSLAVLVTRWHKKLVAYSYRQTHDMEVSKDLVQEGWQAIIKSIGSLKDPAKFRVWAFRIVHNKVINWIRSQQKQRVMEQELQFEENSQEEEDPDFGPIRRAIDKLPSEQRTILTFFYHHNYSMKEISEILNINVGTVKSRLYHARQKVKEYYTS